MHAWTLTYKHRHACMHAGGSEVAAPRKTAWCLVQQARGGQKGLCCIHECPMQVNQELLRQAIQHGASYNKLMEARKDADSLCDEELLAMPFDKLYKAVRASP
eukprot:scaffold151430_cov23-Tisochrysis_lutea.AAC.1